MKGVWRARNGTRQQPWPGLTTQLPFQTQTYGAPGAVGNRAGRIMLQEDASGWQVFSYGKLGEVTENIRTFALPFESRPYTFKMSFEYDSWNRVQNMTYPGKRSEIIII